MRTMRNRRIGTLARTAALLTLCIAAASALAGCGDQGASGRTEKSPERASDAAADEPAGGSRTPARVSEADAGGAAETAGEADVAPNAAGAGDDRKPDANGWHARPPMLLGAGIGEPEADVRRRFGDPGDAYRLQDPPVTVLEYDGFAIGIGEDGRVRYVEIHGPELAAGIGGLAVGVTADETLEALGEPVQASDTVLLYRRDGVALKIDFDPNTRRIASILLFAES